MRIFNFLFERYSVVSGMTIKFLFISLFVSIAGTVTGQTVIVNPDGTHTIVTGNVIVHPNGTHSVIHKAGDHSVVVGPDGRHTVIVGSNQTGSKTIIHPDGRHSVVQQAGPVSIVVGSDGRHSVVHAAGPHSVVVGPDGTHTVVMNQQLPNSGVVMPVQGQLSCTLHNQLGIILALMQ